MLSIEAPQEGLFLCLPISPPLALLQEGSCACLDVLHCPVHIKICEYTGPLPPCHWPDCPPSPSPTSTTLSTSLPIFLAWHPCTCSFSNGMDTHRPSLDGCLTACFHIFPYTPTSLLPLLSLIHILPGPHGSRQPCLLFQKHTWLCVCVCTDACTGTSQWLLFTAPTFSPPHTFCLCQCP